MARIPETCVLGFPDYRLQAGKLAETLQLDYRQIEVHHFPDGESKLTLPENLPRQVVLCQPLDWPNRKLIELMLAAGAARELGVERLILAAPYLCYMRQDKAFRPGEAVSQQIVGAFLAQRFDAVVTVDAHLHRVQRLAQAIPLPLALNLSAAEAMGRFLRGEYEHPLLIGPDAESQQWVASIAARDRLDYRIARKRRRGDRDVEVSLADGDYRGRDVVLVDDVASTGNTLEQAALQLRRREVRSISVLVTHALFVDDACERLARAGVANIWSCDSIPHATNRVSLAAVLATGLREAIGDGF